MSNPSDNTPVSTQGQGGFRRGVSLRRDRDPIYRDPVHTEPRKTAPMAMGSMDMTFLLIVVSLVLYGVIMAYSASSIYAIQHKGDSLYYIKRHLMTFFHVMIVKLPLIAQ